ncbi:MAG TPA: PD-(D/E)XK nuclease family protein [Candidatus Limnocylindrales bacterium]|nr:PD-(D/E)XK nuclease family protein [Candidatus Limnocylindrales bacterium]
MTGQIRIPAKELGELTLPDFCPCCFWIKLHLPEGLPFQIFPGIFNSIDAYTKRLIQKWFDQYGRPPSWLSDLGDIHTYREPPHHSKFQVFDPDTSILLTGTPDAVFVQADGSYLIADYKTARFTGTQDKLSSKYEVQLNAYAYIGEHCGLSPVSGLALIYLEPVIDVKGVDEEDPVTPEGFILEFSAKILPVRLDFQKIPLLVRKVREIYDQDRPPRGVDGCKNCELLRHLMTVATA